jgi:flagellar FliL protein
MSPETVAGAAPDAAPASVPDAPEAKAATRADKKGKKSKKGAAGAEGEKKGSKKKLIIVGLVVVLAVGYVAKGKLMKTVYKPGQPVPAGTIDPLSQMTMNLSDGHLAEVTVALQLTKVADAKTVTADTPRFEDAIITVFGGETYAQLLTNAGKNTARQQILQQCQQILGTTDGAAEQVSAVYFTDFVLQ